jgi:hypothetical protein
MDKIPFTPAEPEAVKVGHEQPLADPRVCRAVIAAILVKGGVSSVALSQADLTAVAKLVLLDGRAANGDFLVALGMRGPDGVVHPFDPNIVQGH